MKTVFLCCVLVCVFSAKTIGSHIMGGEMTYKCLGNSNYGIQLILYRDCQSINQPITPFDSPTYITIFKGDGSIFTMNGDSSQQVNYSTIQAVPNAHFNPCTILPTNVCVDKAIYNFMVHLPFDTLGHFIAYERCCRAYSIVNLKNPGITGITIQTFISDEAQNICNNSPTFNASPPILICLTDSVQVDLSASDADGDSLVYSLCSAYSGASPYHPQPTIATSPPFGTVSYETGYSFTQPFAGNVNIHPQTGFLTGIVNTFGYYVFSVCVDEYRNGVWLSSIQRDFAFAAINCVPAITADLQKDETDSTGAAIILSCDSTVQFFNNSTHPAFIDSYLWSFNIDSQWVQSTATNPTISFPNEGTYEGQLYVEGSTPQLCADSINILVKILPDTLNIDFSYQYDSSVIEAVQFTQITPSALTKSYWTFGDGHYSSAFDPLHYYSDSGTYQVQLMSLDSISCGFVTKEVAYYPIPILLSNKKTLLFENIELYPNPSQEQTILSFEYKKGKHNFSNDLEIVLYNSVGQLIFSKKENLHLGNNQITISTSSLENGIYWLFLKNENRQQTLKLFKVP